MRDVDRKFQIRINRFRSASLSWAASDLYSQICFANDDLSDWIAVEASPTVIAQLQVAGLVDVRVEG